MAIALNIFYRNVDVNNVLLFCIYPNLFCCSWIFQADWFYYLYFILNVFEIIGVKLFCCPIQGKVLIIVVNLII